MNRIRLPVNGRQSFYSAVVSAGCFIFFNECMAFVLVLPLVLEVSPVDLVFIRTLVRPLFLHDTGIDYTGRKSVKPHIGTYGAECISFAAVLSLFFVYMGTAL